MHTCYKVLPIQSFSLFVCVAVFMLSFNHACKYRRADPPDFGRHPLLGHPMPGLVQPAVAMQDFLFRTPKHSAASTARLQRIMLCTCMVSICLAAISCAVIGLYVVQRQMEVPGCGRVPPPSLRSEMTSPLDPVWAVRPPPAAPRDVRGQLGIDFTSGVDGLRASAIKSRQEWLKLATLWMLVRVR